MNPSIQVTSIKTNPFNNEVATTDTIEQMISVVHESVGSPTVLAVVHKLGLDRHTDTMAMLRDVWRFVRSHLRYVDDENHLEIEGMAGYDRELIQTPDWLLSHANPDPKGDCNSAYSVLCASLLCNTDPNLGIYFVTVKATPDDPNLWSHVYVAVKCPCGRVVTMDCSHGPFMGWELNTESVFEKRIWTIQSHNEMGLNGTGVSGGDNNNMMINTPTNRHTGLGTGGGLSGLRGMTGIGDGGYTSDDNIALLGGVPLSVDVGGGSGLSSFWQNIISAGVNTASTVVKAQMAVPPQGTYIRNADGSVVYRPANAAIDPYGNFGLPNVGGAMSSISPTVLLGIGALALLFMFKK